jgi:orotidine-5'-phosphate decarboxylase
LKGNEKLIVALDVRTPAEVTKLVGALKDVVRMFKVGSQLFTSTGPGVITEIVDSGARVFLDLKFHDIPHQVEGAARAATRLGVSMFTIHASGGSEMMKRAVDGVADEAAKQGRSRPAVVAVTALTSLDQTALAQIGIMGTTESWVLRLASLAEETGVNGVVASPNEIGVIRSQSQPDFLIVTPGIRPAKVGEAAPDDQKRVATPAHALRAGADYLVVGRPITGAKDAAKAAHDIVAEMKID